MSLLKQRAGRTGTIEERFVEQALRDQAASILRDSRREQRGFSSPKWRHVNMAVDKNSLTYEHLAVHRFVDMKTRKASHYIAATKKLKANREKKKKFYPIHNKVIMSHKRFLVKTLSFGFTDEVKAQFRALAERENIQE